jgi:succinoglycan biosynthesis transport protein ExoP
MRPRTVPWSRDEHAESSADLGDLLLWIWRRKLVLAGFVAGAMALCTAVLWQTTPVYTAQGVLLVGAPPERIINLQGVVSPLSAEVDATRYDDAVRYEIEVLQAPALAGAVADRLSLDRNPEFNPRRRAPTAWETGQKFLKEVVGRMHLLLGKPAAERPEDSLAAERAGVVRSFLSGLSVSSREKSRLLDIRFTSENRDLAATIVNAFFDIYIGNQVEKKYKATVRATELLRQNVTSWQERTLQSEKRIEEFRRRADLLEGEQGVLLLRQISETNAQLSAARLARGAAEARLREIEESGPDAALDGTREISQSPVIQTLRKRQADLMGMEAGMLTKYRRDHPRVAVVRTELSNLRDEISLELSRLIKGLKVELAADRSVERILSDALDRLKQQVAAADVAKVELQALRREADANRTILNVFMTRLAETVGQAGKGMLQPDASVISPAVVPLQPSYPRPKLFFALALVLGIATGLLFIFLTDWLRRGFYSGDEVEAATGVPVLGLLPCHHGRWSLPRVAGLHRGAVPLPSSTSGGRLRVFETSVQWLGNSLSILDDKPRSLLLTSVNTAEGKTTTAVCLSRFLGRVNGKVVVVDADLCRPGIHEAFKVPAGPGLRDVLLGRASLDSALHKDPSSSVYTLPAGTADRHWHDGLQWSAFEPLIAKLQQSFDLIVIDGPPILEAPEARLLSKISDATLLVVHWAKTDRRFVIAGLEQIEQAGGHPAGILLSMVEPRRYARYSQRDSHQLLFDGGRRCTH